MKAPLKVLQFKKPKNREAIENNLRMADKIKFLNLMLEDGDITQRERNKIIRRMMM